MVAVYVEIENNAYEARLPDTEPSTLMGHLQPAEYAQLKYAVERDLAPWNQAKRIQRWQARISFGIVFGVLAISMLVYFVRKRDTNTPDGSQEQNTLGISYYWPLGAIIVGSLALYLGLRYWYRQVSFQVTSAILESLKRLSASTGKTFHLCGGFPGSGARLGEGSRVLAGNSFSFLAYIEVEVAGVTLTAQPYAYGAGPGGATPMMVGVPVGLPSNEQP